MEQPFNKIAEQLGNSINESINIGGNTTGTGNVKTIDLTGLFGQLCNEILDTDTKNFVDKLVGCEKTSDRINLLREFHEKNKNSEIPPENPSEIPNREKFPNRGKNEMVEENIDSLVEEERSLKSRISALNLQDQKEFYAKLYQIPTERDVHIKLDAILEKVEDMQAEISILRKQLYSLTQQ
jgi:hypothetical protein